ncbi:MAG: ABC transporter permease [Clostridium sp.]|uniref:ABC transporter permease n=1 Tax=Clostridium sp. TaxID=1506 RepID=UPI002FC674EE
MLTYIGKRLFASLLTLWIVITATFFLIHSLPGGPFQGEKNYPPEVLASMNAKYGLDKPISEQYVNYITGLLKGDLGPSLKYQGRTVNDIVGYSFPASAKLGLVTVVISVVIGTWMGIVSALNQGKWQDKLCMVVSTFGVTVPSFVLATFLIYIFSLNLRLLPTIGFSEPIHYIMPVLALGGYSIAFISRLSRSSLLDVIRQDYMRTAKAKGLSQRTITYKHALKNSLIPIITYLGPLTAAIITGSFVVEQIFGIPGLGREFVTTINNRDYTAIMGITVFYSSLVIFFNFIVDILYSLVDPRIKLGQ